MANSDTFYYDEKCRKILDPSLDLVNITETLDVAVACSIDL
jgi:hypothetical protein